MPCNNCVRTGKPTCTYDSHPPLTSLRRADKLGTGSAQSRSSHQRPHSNDINQISGISSPSVVSSHPPDSSIASSILADSPNYSLPASCVPSMDVEAMQKRIKQLEEQLSKEIGPTPLLDSGSRLKTTVSASYMARSHAVHESRLFGSCHVISRGVMHKSRLFGQSHWGNGIADVVSTHLVVMFVIFELLAFKG